MARLKATLMSPHHQNSARPARPENVAYLRKNRLIATGSRDRSARIWDAAARRELVKIRGERSWIWGVAFSPDGKMLAMSGDGGSAKFWDVTAGRSGRPVDVGAAVLRTLGVRRVRSLLPEDAELAALGRRGLVVEEPVVDAA